MVASSELVGSALFVYMILVSKGDELAVPLALFAVILIFGGITGGHFNPAVTIGVYIKEGKYKENLILCVLLNLAQFVGALAGMGMATFTLSVNVNGEYQVPESKVPILAPKDPSGVSNVEMGEGKDGFIQDW